MSKLAKALTAAAGNAGEALYVEDVFSTYLYTGNGSTQTITNGIDLAGEGGLVWTKNRNQPRNHNLVDTERGVSLRLKSNSTDGQYNEVNGVTSFNSDGYSLSTASDYNANNDTYASWTFRKAPKFFDVVTYTGDGTAGRQISHNLGSAPGFFVVKRTDSADNWKCWHTSTGDGVTLELDGSGADTGENWPTGGFTSTYFTVNSGGSYNASGGTYVAYLFAHDAGGFGDDDESIIKCGSYTGTGSYTNPPVINLGFEPQFVIIKNASSTGDWLIGDIMRGATSQIIGSAGEAKILKANLSNAETSYSGGYIPISPTATGFTMSIDGSEGNASGNTYIYIAIRRPMKTPESGTEVFAATYGDGTAPAFEGVLTDFALQKDTSGGNWLAVDRMRGTKALQTQDTSVESNASYAKFDYMDGWNSLGFTSPNFSWMFKRATGFFDVVAYTGNGVAGRTVNHNLGVAPELIIVKHRTLILGDPAFNQEWSVYSSELNQESYLNETTQFFSGSSYPSAPTSSEFTVGSGSKVNHSGVSFIAYLFASVAGVSKVGSYTGNGTSQTIDCGFSGGARFILIKSTSTTGSWWVYDSARGIVAGNDPALQLNSTAAEVTSADAIDPDSSGFIVNQEATCSINASGVSYIFMSIA